MGHKNIGLRKGHIVYALLTLKYVYSFNLEHECNYYCVVWNNFLSKT